MRCRKCDARAVINMRHHRLALCSVHYVEWFATQTERAIEKYKMFSRHERVLVAVSGGKDSLALWDVLLRLGYQADGLYIGLGINDPIPYSDVSLEKVRKFVASGEWRVASEHEAGDGKQEAGGGRQEAGSRRQEGGRVQEADTQYALRNTPHASRFMPTLHLVDIAQTYGQTIPEIAREKMRGQGRPCAACGLTKRYVMNRLALEKGYNVLATGHNLDDEIAVLFQNTLRWQMGYLARQAPVLPSSREGLVKKAKPFCRFYERETATYALVRGIDYIYDECPHAVGNLTNFYKTLLNQLEAESPGAKLSFYLEFLRARSEGAFAQFNQTDELHACKVCGQPTSAPGRCAFCRMWDIQNSQLAIDN